MKDYMAVGVSLSGTLCGSVIGSFLGHTFAAGLMSLWVFVLILAASFVIAAMAGVLIVKLDKNKP